MISYIGGKSRMAKWICEHIPQDIETYVEVFGGAFWVYIKGDIHEKPNLQKIVYNDKNRFMANMFECFRDPEYMLVALKMYESQNKKTFNTLQSYLNTIVRGEVDYPLGTFPVAAQYAYCATQVFSGSKILESKFVDLKGKYGSKYDSLINKLKDPNIVERLKNITHVENLNYTDIIMKYDSDKTFFYADPPYWQTEDYYSNHNFDSNDHERLITHLKIIKGKFALSYYDFPKLSEWLPKKQYNWISKEFNKAAGAQKGKKQNKGTELLIMNY
tara:strand:+ start:3625 stop:4443 length:819 start_codon:yes stop_codon:yes gene_type:complete